MNDSLICLFRGMLKTLLKIYIPCHYIPIYGTNLQSCTCIPHKKPGLILFLKGFDKLSELVEDPKRDRELSADWGSLKVDEYNEVRRLI